MDPKKIISALGGPVVVAKHCGISPQAVSQWKDKGIPKPWILYFNTKFKKKLRDAALS